MLTKPELRKFLATVRQNLLLREDKNDKITKNTLDFIESRSINSIFSYVSFGYEVDTVKIIKKLLKDKQIYVPYTNNNIMSMQLLEKEDCLKSDKQGNINKINPKFYTNNVDLCIVPMLGFNKDNFRIGYGGGYYDKYLSCNKCISVGLAFDEQFVDFRQECFDVALDFIITPTKLIRRNNGKKTN